MRRRIQLWFRVMVIAGILVTLLAGCSKSPQGPVPPPNAGVAPASSVASPGGVPQEGIKVHGHWTIEVTNPDGTLAERREFDNALGTWGNDRLTLILARQISVAGWSVSLVAGAGGENAFLDASSNPSSGLIRESSDANTFPYLFKTLTVTRPNDGANANKLVLSGTATAQREGQIGRVETSLSALSPTLPPASSYAGGPYSFTNTTLANPVSLSTGQQVAVTVVISFS